MRIFKWVFGGILGIVVAGGLFWLLSERAILLIADKRLEQDIALTRRMTVKGNGVNSCVNSSVAAYQLRFESDTSYVIETVCTDGSAGKVLVTKTLFGGVKRLYGSGIQISAKDTDMADTWVQLQYKTASVAVGYFNGVVGSNWEPQQLTIGGASPAQARCTDWGFGCCDTATEVGSGYQVHTGDCTTTCYQQCHKRPLVLFFNTDPLLNTSNRIVQLHGAKATVAFGFEVADYDDEVKEVVIDFGDKTVSDSLSAKEKKITHDYTCFSSRCVYTAQLLAQDSQGNSLADSAIQKIQVVMQPR